MIRVTPREFRNAFMAVMKSERDGFRTAVGVESKSYNSFMRSNICPKVAKHLGLLSWRKQYHTLDGMFYEERGTDHFGNHGAYAKLISVALEHENTGGHSYETMNKLLPVHTPSQVLITYAAEGTEGDH